ncbi:hypothetical protein B0A48_04873 [Cryoendolithus antarcticus]|uniref:SUN domain-containing protein n=1 Tax=Cryoendolithus antarcticus TaxID=1507870 RepID=A0A1V8TDM1_9PEZI|nr:hypothetical protein B0A48_04873 [Cryoendolithus antarcticus]
MATPRQTRSGAARGPTPARGTTPLPALSTKINTSYGAAGTPNLRGQVATPGQTFAQSMAQAQAQSTTTIRTTRPIVEEPIDEVDQENEEDEIHSPTAKLKETMRDETYLPSSDQYYGASRRKPAVPGLGASRPVAGRSPLQPDNSGEGPSTTRPAPRPPARPAAPVNGPAISQNRDGNQPTTGSHVRQPSNQSGSAPPQGPRSPPPRPQLGAPQQGARTAQDPPPPPSPRAIPSTLDVALFAIPRYLWRNIWALILGAVLLWTFLLMPLPTTAAFRRDELVRAARIAAGYPGYEQPPNELEGMWLQIRYNSSFLKGVVMPEENIPGQQWAINTMLLARVEGIEQNQTLFLDKFEHMEDFLPKMMAVDLQDGRMQIKPEFWQALLRRTEGDRTLYDAFMRTNEQAVRANIEQVSSGHLSYAIQSHQVVGREAVLRLMEENNRFLTTQVTQLLESRMSESLDAARAAAIQVATEIVKELPQDDNTRLAILARTNLLQNQLRNINSFNWLSHRAGARVDPHKTSPTLGLTTLQSFLGYPYESSKHMSKPVYALMEWQEYGEAWCAAESAKYGKAQLAIEMKDAVIPAEFAIENISNRGTRDIASSPREFEVWAEALTEDQAQEYKSTILDYFAHNHREPAGCLAKDPPTAKAVCVADGIYDIHGTNWVQSWPTFVNMQDLVFATKKVYFKIVSNWGAEHTCIYRVRMTEAGHEELPPPLGDRSWLK